MSFGLTLHVEPQEHSAWRPRLVATEGVNTVLLQLFWGDKETATHEFIVELHELQRLVAFAKSEKLEN